MYKEKNLAKYDDINMVLARIIDRYHINIVILAEYFYDLDSLTDLLSVEHKDFKVSNVPQDCRVKLLVDSNLSSEMLRDSRYYFIFKISNLYSQFDFLLTGVHFPSRTKREVDSINLEARDLMLEIKDAEIQESQEKCIIVGDFNLNPFDRGMIEADALHAIPYSDIVMSKESIVFLGKDRPLFYNPMWNFLGDFQERGHTYFYDTAGDINLYRYIFDQVLMSSKMIEYFIPESLKILNEISGVSLIATNGCPNKDKYSDHLPIIFSFEEEK